MLLPGFVALHSSQRINQTVAISPSAQIWHKTFTQLLQVVSFFAQILSKLVSNKDKEMTFYTQKFKLMSLRANAVIKLEEIVIKLLAPVLVAVFLSF